MPAQDVGDGHLADVIASQFQGTPATDVQFSPFHRSVVFVERAIFPPTSLERCISYEEEPSLPCPNRVTLTDWKHVYNSLWAAVSDAQAWLFSLTAAVRAKLAFSVQICYIGLVSVDGGRESFD